MADITGMFQDPNAIRQSRIDDILKQYQATSQMGGSMNQLLGQVAAAGSNVGNLMAEGAAGMFGMTTPQEAQAKKIQEMASVIDWNAPEDLNQFAMALNDMGMTKQAIQVLEKRQGVINQQNADADRAEKKAKGDIRRRTTTIPVSVPIWDTKKTKIVGYKKEMQTVSWDQTWDAASQKWLPENPPMEGNADAGGAIADNPAVRMPAGQKKVVTDPMTGKEVTLDTNVMVNSKNKPVLDMPMIQGLRNWWNNF
jgi:hypothetical protein